MLEIYFLWPLYGSKHDAFYKEIYSFTIHIVLNCGNVDYTCFGTIINENINIYIFNNDDRIQENCFSRQSSVWHIKFVFFMFDK